MRIKMPRSHRCSEGLSLNQRQQLVLAYRRFDFQAITGRRDLHLIQSFRERRIALRFLIAAVHDAGLHRRAQQVCVIHGITHGLEMRIHAAIRVDVDDHRVQAPDDGGGLRELPGLRNQLLHGEVRVVFVQHGPDDAVAVGFGDQRE